MTKREKHWSLWATGFLAAVVAAAWVTAARAEPLPKEALAEMLKAGTVEVYEGSRRICSGFLIDAQTVMTARHCMSVEDMKVMQGYNYAYPKSRTFASQKKNSRQQEDWALLHLSDTIEGASPLQLGCSIKMKVGDPVVYAGFPSIFDLTISWGTVISEKPASNLPSYWSPNSDFFTDLVAAPGASGSPVLDANTGTVVGLLIEGGQGFIGIQKIGDTDICDALGEDAPTDDKVGPILSQEDIPDEPVASPF